MENNVFGLDIGTTAIRVVWLDHGKDTITYLSSLTGATPTSGMQSESPFDHQEMAQLINKLVIDAKITTNNVNIALPEHHVFTKVIDMPVLSEKELSSAIYWEAEQYIPAPLNTMTLDWSILRKPEDAKSERKMQVLLVAAPLNLIKRYQSVLELAGLSVVSIETEVLSVIRGAFGKSTVPTSLLMNIGALTTSLSIVQEGIIVFNYPIPLGGTALTRAITADFGFDTAQAEEYKKVYGISDKNLGGKIGKAIEPILTSLLSEMKKAITFYTEKFRNEYPISQIVLTGGGAALPGIGLYFAENIGIETVSANPWKAHDIQKVPPEIESQGSAYTIGIGLALKEYE